MDSTTGAARVRGADTRRCARPGWRRASLMASRSFDSPDGAPVAAACALQNGCSPTDSAAAAAVYTIAYQLSAGASGDEVSVPGGAGPGPGGAINTNSKSSIFGASSPVVTSAMAVVLVGIAAVGVQMLLGPRRYL